MLTNATWALVPRVFWLIITINGNSKKKVLYLYEDACTYIPPKNSKNIRI